MDTVRYLVLRRTYPDPVDGLDDFGSSAAPRENEGVELTSDNVHVSAIADLERDNDVLASAPDIPVELIVPTESNVAATNEIAWGIAAVGATGSAFDGAGVKIALLDTGVDLTHPAFDGVCPVERDFTGTGPGDKNGHGTHCAGTILGRDVGGRIGIARGVKDLLIGKVLDSNGRGSAENLYKAMLWAAEEGAHIISMSVGFAPTAMVERLHKEGWPIAAATSVALQSYGRNLRLFDSVMDMFRTRRHFGREVLVVAASGNDSLRAKDPRMRVAASLPSAAEAVVSVGAVGQTSNGLSVANFSNILPTLCGPGVGVRSAWIGGIMKTLDGTSMACPHVAGVAALWWQSLGAAATADLVRSKLLANCHYGDMAPGYSHSDIGYGLVKAP